MKRATTDDGHTTDRLATIDPLELHQAIVNGTIRALREGAPLEQLDGLDHFRVSGIGRVFTDTRARREAHLRERVDELQTLADRARDNANRAATDRSRASFIADADAASDELEKVLKELADLEGAEGPSALPEEITTEIGYLAHALAGLATIASTADRSVADALEQILRITRVDPLPDGTVRIEFTVLVPAAGSVLAFGPIVASVANRANRGTLSEDARFEEARSRLAEIARSHDPTARWSQSQLEALLILKKRLVERGYTDLAAGTLIRSCQPALFSLIAHELWEEPLPSGLGDAFVAHVQSTYRDPEFTWEPRRHRLDVSRHQQLVDAVMEQGGEAGQLHLLEATSVKAHHIALYSRDQQYGNGPPWRACVERVGDWRQQSPRSGRSLRAIACPHCGGRASLVIRVPEVPDGLLCPDCRRMPSRADLTFPEDYFP